MPCGVNDKTCNTRKLAIGAADFANAECLCVTLDRSRLAAILDAELGEAGAGKALLESHPNLFAGVPIFMSPARLAQMKKIVSAIERATQTPAFRSAVGEWAPAVATHDFGPKGVFMGYDFHLTPNGPKLIEINTNAGGAYLNALLASAQLHCCGETQSTLLDGTSQASFPARIASMFEHEWRAQGRMDRPACIAIVDENPDQQLLYPEFLTARSLLRKFGFEAIIAAPESLNLSSDGLFADNRKVDFVYNRLVDFTLDRPENRTLREAYLKNRVVVSPNPFIHTLYADKRNLSFLSNSEWLAGAGLDSQDCSTILAAVPETVLVESSNSEQLWSDRRNWFFKPARGYGSKAAYRGAKLTKRVWAEIVASEYVAQRFTPPSTRKIRIDAETVELKVDVRLYTYAGEILLVAARLYQGQATNMRTAGGGFAPVLTLANSTT